MCQPYSNWQIWQPQSTESTAFGVLQGHAWWSWSQSGGKDWTDSPVSLSHVEGWWRWRAVQCRPLYLCEIVRSYQFHPLVDPKPAVYFSHVRWLMTKLRKKRRTTWRELQWQYIIFTGSCPLVLLWIHQTKIERTTSHCLATLYPLISAHWCTFFTSRTCWTWPFVLDPTILAGIPHGICASPSIF